MGNVTYYPAQKITANGGEINFAQSASVDFSVPRQLVYEFGNLYPIDNVQVEAATATLDFSYALVNSTNAGVLGLSSIQNLLSDVEGKTYSLIGAGSLTLTKGLISSFSAEGSVGNIPTASVSVQALGATYSAGSPTFPAGSAESSSLQVIRPDEITVSIGGSLPCRSFSFNVEIPREYVSLLGETEPVAIFVSGPPKVSVEAEVVLLNGADPFFEVNEIVTASINCRSIGYSVTNGKITNFTTNSSLDGVQIATVTIEAPLSATVSIGG